MLVKRIYSLYLKTWIYSLWRLAAPNSVGWTLDGTRWERCVYRNPNPQPCYKYHTKYLNSIHCTLRNMNKKYFNLIHVHIAQLLLKFIFHIISKQNKNKRQWEIKNIIYCKKQNNKKNIIIPNLPNADKNPVSLGPGSPFIRCNQIPYHVLLTAKKIQTSINQQLNLDLYML